MRAKESAMRDHAYEGEAEELRAILDGGTTPVDACNDALLLAVVGKYERYGRTPHPECVELLLAAGADPKAKAQVREIDNRNVI